MLQSIQIKRKEQMNFPFLSDDTFNTLILEAQELSEASNRKGTGILSLHDFAMNVILLYNQLQIENELKRNERSK